MKILTRRTPEINRQTEDVFWFSLYEYANDDIKSIAVTLKRRGTLELSIALCYKCNKAIGIKEH